MIYSGGLDSTTLLYDYQKEIKIALTFNYGSKHNAMEYHFAQYHTHRLNIRHVYIDISFLKFYLKSSLLQKDVEIPKGRYDDESMKSTVVPFRNGIMISIATGIAESEGLNTVFYAPHKGDHPIYPDCSILFRQWMSASMREGTEKNIELNAPYLWLTKKEVVGIGKRFNIEYEKTYSCYEGREKHCGVCGTCNERKEALNGFDKTEYEK